MQYTGNIIIVSEQCLKLTRSNEALNILQTTAGANTILEVYIHQYYQVCHRVTVTRDHGDIGSPRPSRLANKYCTLAVCRLIMTYYLEEGKIFMRI